MPHLGDRVAAYVDGQLPADEAERADAHLASCEDCFDAVLAQRRLKRRMTGLGTTPSPSSSLLSALSDPARLAAAAPPSRLHVLREHLVVRATLATSGAFAVLAGIGYVIGAPQIPVDTVTPPVDRFVAQFRGESDPIAQSVRAAAQPAEVAYAVAPGHAVAPGTGDAPTAVRMLERALGSAASVKLLSHRYDLSLRHTASGRTEVVVASHGHRVATYVLDQAGRVSQVIRYDPRSGTSDPAVRAMPSVTRAELARAPMAPGTSGDGAAGEGQQLFAATGTGPGSGAASGRGSLRGVTGDRIDAATIQTLTSVGWPCHERLGGRFERVAARWVDLAGDKAIALTYTDGVSTLTVYEQSGALDRTSTAGFRRYDVDGTAMWMRDGSPAVATWDADGIVFTVVTDGPSEHLRDAAQHLPRRPQHDGMLDRVRTGLARLTEWATPGADPEQ